MRVLEELSDRTIALLVEGQQYWQERIYMFKDDNVAAKIVAGHRIVDIRLER